MFKSWPKTAKVLSCLFLAPLCALPQAYTISAKPGAVNYVEGSVLLDGQSLAGTTLKSTFMNAGSILETNVGKAEVLLTPGVFLRVGDNSLVRMLRPSLVNTQLAIESGESMLEVDEYIHDSHLTVTVRGTVVEIEKNGLYRFVADADASVAVIDGKAQVTFGDKHTEVSKGHEALLTDALKTRKFDKDQPDELFAWSNIRSQYNASLTYQAARSVYSSSYNCGNCSGYGSGYYGMAGYYGRGWYWNNGFNSWLWMPGDAAFYSPFGWGFYGPGVVSYAPVVVVPVYVASGGGGAVIAPTKGVIPVQHPHPGPGNGPVVTVPVNPKSLPALGAYAASPSQLAVGRVMAARSIQASGGLQMASPNLRGGNAPQSFTRWSGSNPQAHSSGSSSSSGSGNSGHASGGSSGGAVARAASSPSVGGGGGGSSHSSGGHAGK